MGSDQSLASCDSFPTGVCAASGISRSASFTVQDYEKKVTYLTETLEARERKPDGLTLSFPLMLLKNFVPETERAFVPKASSTPMYFQARVLSLLAKAILFLRSMRKSEKPLGSGQGQW